MSARPMLLSTPPKRRQLGETQARLGRSQLCRATPRVTIEQTAACIRRRCISLGDIARLQQTEEPVL